MIDHAKTIRTALRLAGAAWNEQPEFTAALTALAALQEERERLRADSRRLDWLEKQLDEWRYRADLAIQSDEEDGVWFAQIVRRERGELRGTPYDITNSKTETVRAAIDAAIGEPASGVEQSSETAIGGSGSAPLARGQEY